MASRAAKEAFVSGHGGTSVGEIAAVAAAPVALVLLWRLLRHPAAVGGGLFSAPRPTAGGLLLEFAVLVLPLVACLLGFVQPAPLLGGVAALALALAATQHSEERQARARSARRRALTDLLRCAGWPVCANVVGSNTAPALWPAPSAACPSSPHPPLLAPRPACCAAGAACRATARPSPSSPWLPSWASTFQLFLGATPRPRPLGRA